MITIYIFSASGFAILLLVTTKRLQQKLKKPFFVFNIISKADAQIRALYQKLVHLYSDSKEKTSFLIEKQIPIHSKNVLNKSISFIKEKRDQYIGNIRNSRLLKRPDGISEFFKNMSEIEKGNGEIHEGLEDGSQEDKKGLN